MVTPTTTKVTKECTKITKRREPAFHVARTDLVIVVAFVFVFVTFVIVIGMSDVATL